MDLSCDESPSAVYYSLGKFLKTNIGNDIQFLTKSCNNNNMLLLLLLLLTLLNLSPLEALYSTHVTSTEDTGMTHKNIYNFETTNGANLMQKWPFYSICSPAL
jgi:hypothetical protein